jgi:hypothetical protein
MTANEVDESVEFLDIGSAVEGDSSPRVAG